MSRLVLILNHLLLMGRFVMGGAGSRHAMGPFQRAWMVYRFRRNLRRIKSYSNWRQHLLMAENILRIPKEIPGDVVECGCFNGGSTACLSIVCEAAKRKLYVCDSFDGLPEPSQEEKHELLGSHAIWSYDKGDFSSEGGMEAVIANVRRFGSFESCEFVKGYFAETLPQISTRSVVMVFEDADLRSSTEDCLRHLWPKLQNGCRFYSHEPFSVPVVSLFYDATWWKETLGIEPPGFHGSGDGICEVMVPSMLGYAVKFDREKARKKATRIEGKGPSRFLGILKQRC